MPCRFVPAVGTLIGQNACSRGMLTVSEFSRACAQILTATTWRRPKIDVSQTRTSWRSILSSKCEHTCWAARRRKVANLDEVGVGSPIIRRNSLTGSFTATTAAVEVWVDVPVPGVCQAAALQPPVLDPVHHVAPLPNLIRLRVAHKVALKISSCSPQYLFQKITSFILYKQGQFL